MTRKIINNCNIASYILHGDETGKPFPQQKMRSDWLFFRYQEPKLEKLVPSLLCQRAEGGEELTQAVRRINSKSCNSCVTEPPNYTKLSKKIIQGADDLANLRPYNPVVREITTDFKPVHITTKIVLSLAVTIISYIKVYGTKYIGV
jgi:hypothetical protein